MRRMALLGCCLLLAAAGRSSAAEAARELAPAEKEKARALLRRLADRNFKAREQATAELLGSPIVQGRMADASRADEVVVDQNMRRKYGLDIGGSFFPYTSIPAAETIPGEGGLPALFWGGEPRPRTSPVRPSRDGVRNVPQVPQASSRDRR